MNKAIDESNLPPGWRINSWDCCLGCNDKTLGRMERVQRKGTRGRGVFIFRVCLACGHGVCVDKSHEKSIGLNLTSEPGKYL
jgi:hypothetical protein